MLEGIIDQIEHLRWEDLLDLVIFTVLIYGVLTWLQDRASRAVLIVSAILSSVFLLARAFDLYLTFRAFEYGAIFLLLSLVVVFQQDIRHGFEKLSTFSSRLRNRSSTAGEGWIDVVAEAVATMADDRTGALIVFPGEESLDRHLRGGVEVDAIVSLPLLLSIFHPKSPGHDGAIVIDSGRVTMLGLHLPLTKHVESLHDGGTRHAAGLGLAEVSDATILVVSEERGTISVCHDRRIETIASADVIGRINGLAIETSSHRHRRFLHLPRLAIAIAITLLSFLILVDRSDTLQRTLIVPIEYSNLPEQSELLEPRTSFAEITLAGPRPAFDLLEPSSVSISIDLSQHPRDTPASIATAHQVTGIPSDLAIESVNPATLFIELKAKGNTP
ncbi:diadenylate cyclase [Roseiconus lacunae]|uniref:diadenylate cyclase n=1 Tax=Roseiconus lacunae TaxID=2605694 RepID=UPI001E43496F|nr:diadenylate cyclase [Roseiconus lacunae]MCD0462765.1 diadenylate cyclase [Roseiconus lacunae]WRQ50097.1 diadenylate cyclase [Stieleria sp. HD01]